MIVENKVLPADNKMINFSCKNYHYSGTVPIGRKMAFAIFEEGSFIGTIIYSLGANAHIGEPFGLRQGEVIELTRVALRGHKNFVSYYLSKTFHIIKEKSPRVKILVSYADAGRYDHHGGIYQATNWIYLGESHGSGKQYYYNKKWTHVRTLYNSRTKEEVDNLVKTLPSRPGSIKHKYIYCLDKKLRRKYSKLSKPYPKREGEKGYASR